MGRVLSIGKSGVVAGVVPWCRTGVVTGVEVAHRVAHDDTCNSVYIMVAISQVKNGS
jgi:hypothetical protein